MKFDFRNYQGRLYVMHCETEEQANYFCSFLHDAGKTWCTGQSYLGKTCWSAEGNGICYAFVDGTYGSYDWFTKSAPEYEILEFEDFEWEGFVCVSVDPTHIDAFLNDFIVS